ncbi:hypothetical protein AA0114_g3833 [Alternaria tenuissima]|uniref:Heterokaryon incompatibility domain-containing protein n=1 Tax=Alternaria tenuissima TaxID=119927 RepID=A0A4Q4MPC1_9PLEO|nr:hypothetical protein AA0114_g3833 [Alternaria tenuissima]
MSSRMSDAAASYRFLISQPPEWGMQQSSLAALDLRTETSLPSLGRETFKHEPLPVDERFIRLITIEPTLSQPDGLIQCSMSRTRLLGAHYTCLSYRWGDPEPRKLILINGKQASIQTNLFDFFDTVRSTFRDAIWIDALCINQDDSAEKNHQVAHMGELYSEAQCVYAWLGRPSEPLYECNSILEYLKREACNRIKEKEREDKDWITGLSAILNEPPKEDSKAVSHTPDETKWVVGAWLERNLYANKYWQRCWIIKEIILARHVVVWLGSDASEFSQLVEAAVQSDMWQFRASVFAQFAVLSTGRSNFIGKGLITLLADFSMARSTFDQDRIFAFVSLCREKAKIEIDYTNSVKQVVYKTLTDCQESLCLCSAFVVFWNFFDPNPGNDRISVLDLRLEVDVRGLRFSYWQEGQAFQLDEDRESAHHRRNVSVRQISSVKQYDPRHTCSLLPILLRYLFGGAIVVRLHKDCPSQSTYNTKEDYFLSDLQSNTTIPIRSLTDQFSNPVDWIGIEDEQNYICTRTFTVQSTQAGHLISVPVAVLRKFLHKLPNSREFFSRPLRDSLTLCQRALGQKSDCVGCPTLFRLRQGP